MRNYRQRDGSIGIVLVIVFLSITLIGTLVFGFWAFSERSTYKDNSDKLSEEAVEVALEKQKTELENQFAEQEKQPFETYSGPAELGSLGIAYPKTWELYIDQSKNGSTELSGYAHPGYVPGVSSDTSFALRFEVLSDQYSDVLKDYDNSNKKGAVKVSPFRADQVQSVVGSRLEGAIKSKKTGSLVILPVRDKTLMIWTEGPSFTGDFNTVLASLTFVP